jgi:pimeloyl-ACP methyl ester carboxylesterase
MAGKLGVLLTGVRVPRPENEQSPADYGLEYQTQRIAVDSTVTLECWQIPVTMPRGCPRGCVVLFHGYAACKSEMLPEAIAFHDLGYEVWLVDFRGSGGSSERYTTIGFLEADDVAAVVSQFPRSSRVGPLILFGRSMGAAAILRAIHVHGADPDAVVLESVFDRLSTTTENRFRLMGLPAFPAANLLTFWGGLAAGIDAQGHNPVDYARQCVCPTLLLHGELDPNARLEEARRVQGSLGDPGAELVNFSGTGHSPTLAADPQAWQAAMSRFEIRIAP